MGASLGLALKQRHLCQEVVGLVRREAAVAQAQALGIVDWATIDPKQALQNADIVIFGTPVRTLIDQMHQYAHLYRPNAIITDMGSTKSQIASAMDSLPPGLQPVGSHPMCGKEKSGMEAAEAGLFEGAPWIITPLPRTDPQATRRITELAQGIGSRVRLMSAQQHDLQVAAVSHLPHMLAVALMTSVLEVAQDEPEVWQVAASGFRDTSRVAAAGVEMWLDILFTNQQAVRHTLTIAKEHLQQMITALVNGDEATIEQMMAQAARQRSQMFTQSVGDT